MSRHRIGRSKTNQGLTLAEVVVSTILVGLLMVAALRSLTASVATDNQSIAVAQSMMLARQLLDETISLPYEDPDQTPLWGMESGESSGRRVRGQADDIDDLDQWIESSVEDRDGNRLTAFSSWSRKIEIEKVHYQDGELQSLPNSANDTGLRRVKVTVARPGNTSIHLEALRSRNGGTRQLQGSSQEIVSWVGITLQPSRGSAVMAGVSLLNHASDQ